MLFLNNITSEMRFANYGDTVVRKLEDLFDISTGVIESKYKLVISGNPVEGKKESEQKPVIFVRLGSLDHKNSIIKIDEDLKKYNDSYSKDVITEGVEIPSTKVLRSNDYLINMRGLPKGFSMLKTFEHDTLGYYVPNNQFVVLKPRVDLPYLDKYLHLILDLILMPFLELEYYKEKSNQKSPSFNSFKITKVVEFKIKLLKDIESQKKVVENLLKCLGDLREAENKLKDETDAFAEFFTA